MQTAVFALIVRELQKRFITNVNSKRSLGVLWLVFEPITHIALWTGFRLYRTPDESLPMSIVLFILLGALPWLFISNTVGACGDIIGQNNGLVVFRQIKPIDAILALLMTELGVMTMVYIVGFISLSALQIPWQMNNLLLWFTVIIFYALFALGLSLIVAITSYFFRTLRKLNAVIIRVLYLFSGVFFSAKSLSPAARPYFEYNPLFQFVELSRSCFSSLPFESGDVVYLGKCAIISLTLGLGLYVTLQRRIMINIFQH